MNTIEKLKTVNPMSAEVNALVKKLQGEQHQYIAVTVDGKEIIRHEGKSPFHATFEAASDSVVEIENVKIYIEL
jgi:hypothetical protein